MRVENHRGNNQPFVSRCAFESRGTCPGNLVRADRIKCSLPEPGYRGGGFPGTGAAPLNRSYRRAPSRRGTDVEHWLGQGCTSWGLSGAWYWTDARALISQVRAEHYHGCIPLLWLLDGRSCIKMQFPSKVRVLLAHSVPRSIHLASHSIYILRKTTADLRNPGHY